jgi:hypothetical protein
MASEKGKCPTCSASIPLDSVECPECGETFSGEVTILEEEEVTRVEGRRERLLFWLGLVLAGLGGFFSLGSFAHDWFSIPIIGMAFDEFGWVNRIFATVGLIALIIGIVFLILSLRLTKVVSEEDYEVGAP